MTDRELYKSTFGRLFVSGEAKDRILSGAAESARRTNRGRRFAAAGAAAAVLLVSLSVTALAVVNYPDIIGWFNRIWGSATETELSDAQVRAITELTGDIGISAEDNGMTVTAESLVLGDNRVQILFSAEIPDGSGAGEAQAFGFEDVEAAVSPEPSSPGVVGCAGYSIDFYSWDKETGRVGLVLDYNMSMPNGEALSSGKYAISVTLRNLIAASTGKIVREGEWNFVIPLNAGNAERVIVIEHAAVQGYSAETGEMSDVELRGIRISATGIRYSYEADGRSCQFSISAVMKDGTTVAVSTGSGYLDSDGKTWVDSFNWLVPVSLDELESIRFYQTRIAID